MSGLKSCPFCGSDNVVVPEEVWFGDELIPKKQVQCNGCGASGPLVLELDCIAAWNKRVWSSYPKDPDGFELGSTGKEVCDYVQAKATDAWHRRIKKLLVGSW